MVWLGLFIVFMFLVGAGSCEGNDAARDTFDAQLEEWGASE